MDHTLSELMVAAAAREIREGETVFVGMRLPLLAFLLAKSTHAPNAVGFFENGVIRDTPSVAMLYTMSDPPNINGAVFCGEMLTVMGSLQRGAIALGFIGGAQIDRFGNLNTTMVGEGARATRLPGSGGACDIASLAHRTLIIMAHERRRFVERVDYCTSPGYGNGGDWRERVGLPRGGPAAVITTRGVIRFSDDTHEAYLASYHPRITIAEIRANTGWDLRVAPSVSETGPPTAAELDVIRRLDPEKFWTS